MKHNTEITEYTMADALFIIDFTFHKNSESASATIVSVCKSQCLVRIHTGSINQVDIESIKKYFAIVYISAEIILFTDI